MEDAKGHERVGVLVVSLRRLSPDGGLVAQLTAIDDLDADQRVITVTGNADVVLARVREWLTAVSGGAPLAW
jgi:hypothetical protein